MNTDRTRTVCRYCGTFADIIGEFDRPDHHTSARCVEMKEPIRNTDRVTTFADLAKTIDYAMQRVAAEARANGASDAEADACAYATLREHLGGIAPGQYPRIAQVCATLLAARHN